MVWYMSIMQDYEKLRKKLGDKKYEAIDEYIKIYGKVDEWHQGVKDIRSIENIKEWENKMFDLHQKCKPIFIDDIVMNEEEWNKFEKWYEENKDKLKHYKTKKKNERGAR